MIDFLGRTHILILHLPIGILLFAALLEWSYLIKKVTVSKATFTFIYLLGALSAIFACISGYVLSQSYAYMDAETENHFWAGLATAAIATLTYIINFTSFHHLRKWLVLALATAIAITGHLGGSLTHGEGFLSPSLQQEEDSSVLTFAVGDVAEAEVYDDIIAPLLENKCVSCHGPNKVKGKLRMDSPEHLSKNGKSGNKLLAAKGELARRISLPSSHDKHMPPDTRSQLTEEQIRTIQWWLSSGASFSGEVQELVGHEELLPLLSKMVDDASGPADERKNVPALMPDTDVSTPDTEAMEVLRQEGVMVLKMSDESNFLELNFVNVDSFSEKLIPYLERLKDNVVRLRMSGLPYAHRSVTAISHMSNLMILYLDSSNITDADLLLISALPLLRFLNINDTDVTDEGVRHLGNMPSLTTVHTFRTEVTMDSLGSGVKVERGGFSLAPLETDTIRI